jgi:hypothetical protein
MANKEHNVPAVYIEYRFDCAAMLVMNVLACAFYTTLDKSASNYIKPKETRYHFPEKFEFSTF